MENTLIVNKDTFEASTRHQYEVLLSNNYESRNISFKCGCGEKHLIDDDGAKIKKRIVMLEFVATCPNDYHTLLLCEVKSFSPTIQPVEYSSLISISSK